MHYCNWNIADYASHTGHLSPIEDLAYRRALDFYYLHEKPLAKTVKAVARDLRMVEHEAEVRRVLSAFFVRSADGYRNKRADQEIARYRNRVEAAANAGRTSAQRRLNDRSTTVQRPLNDRSTIGGVQLTKNQEPRTNPPTPQEPDRASREGPGEPEPRPEPRPEPETAAPPRPADDGSSPIADLTAALLETGLRSGSNAIRRRAALREVAQRVAPTGITPADVRALWSLARKASDADGGGLLDEWLVQCAPGYWRDVLAERSEKSEHDRAMQRGVAASASGDDLLAGIYGSTEKPAGDIAREIATRRAQ